MNFFNAGDWLVIFVYLAGIIGLGLWFGKGQRNTRDYFLGGRNVPWWAIGASIVATETSALTIIGVPAIAFGGSFTFIQMVLGYVIARVLLAIVMVPHYLKGEIYSPYQLLANAFGAGARRTAAGFFLISETLAAGVRVYVACIPLQLMLGLEVLPAIFLFVILSLIYTYVGGVKAVIWTDAVQFGLFVAGGVFTLWYVPTLLEGGWRQVFGEAAAAGKLRWLNTGFSLSLPFNIWMGIIGGTFITLSSHGAEQVIAQRVLACGTVADGRKALVLSAILILPLFLMFLVVGVMLWVYYQHVLPAIPIPEPRPGIKANDFIYPIFMLTAVPHWFKGFLIVALLSAAMSSVSSALTSLASVSTMDFVKPILEQRRSERFYLAFSRFSTVFWAAVLIVVAYLSREVVLVLNAAFSLRGLTSGALLGGLLLAWMWKKGASGPIVIGMLVSLLFMIGISLNWFWDTTIDWPWYTLIGTTVTVAIAWGLRTLWPANGAEASPARSGLEVQDKLVS
jgi:solute:Na+ symporter, SSS family